MRTQSASAGNVWTAMANYCTWHSCCPSLLPQLLRVRGGAHDRLRVSTSEAGQSDDICCLVLKLSIITTTTRTHADSTTMEHDCPETPDPTIIAPSACALVFGSYELLQQILMCLPLRDLLLAQKINKTCNGLILRLENISKVLFLVPAAAPVSASPEGPTQRLIWRDADGGRSKHSPVFNTFITA